VGGGTKTLIYFESLKEIMILMLFAIMENFGFRQMTVWWRIRGIFDFLKGKKGWDKFARKGFAKGAHKQGGGWA
jgi:hypothetical protein